MTSLTNLIGRDIAHFSDFVLSADGDIGTVEGLDNIKIALFHRLVTSPGTLIHRPTYGVGIQDFQNAINSIGNQRLIANRIQEQFELDPRVESVTGVSVEIGDSTPDKILILVKIKIRGYDEIVMDFLPFGEI